MESCGGTRRRVSHQGRMWARRPVSRRVGVVLSLFALLVMLASHMVHTVEISIEAARTPASFGLSLHPPSPETPPALSTVAVPRGKSHDPFLCPVCQILSQTRQALVSTGTCLSLAHRSVTCLGCAPLRYAGADLAAAAPRAPPSLT
jgi:hypothetical protein